MYKLDKNAYTAASKLYQSHEAFFPLIAAVMVDEQDGIVYGDDPLVPRRVYVEHAFGFAQVFGCNNAQFDLNLEQYLTIEPSFSSSKVRLYTPSLPVFLKTSAFDGQRSERQRFVFSGRPAGLERTLTDELAQTTLKAVGRDHLARIESNFGAVKRFWRSTEDFLAKALAVVAWHRNEPVAICFAAAIAQGQAEIDVVTATEYRRSGIGKLVVQAFIDNCGAHDLKPVWDCFTNNTGSMALCRASGFKPDREPYAFYTIIK